MKQESLHTDSLLERVRKGDRSVFQEIYLQYYDRLLRYGATLDCDEDFTHDAIQDLFVWLIQHPKKLQNIQQLDTYLFKSLRRNVNSGLQRVRKKKEQARKFVGKQAEEFSPESKWIESEKRNERTAWISRQIKQLSSHQKEVIYLRFYENLSYDEIAAIFSVSNQVVRNSVFRAIKKLRKNASEGQGHPLKGIQFLFGLLM